MTPNPPSLTSSGAVLWSASQGGHTWWTTAADTNSQPGPWITNASAVVATQTALQYAVADASGLTLCSRPFTSTTPSCFTAATGDFSALTVSLLNYGSSTVVRASYLGSDNYDYLWTGGAAVLIQPAGNIAIPDSTTDIFGNAPFLVRRTTTTGKPTIQLVNADGTQGTTIPLPPVSAVQPSALTVGPDRVFGSDVREGSTDTPTWIRSVSGSGFGGETLYKLHPLKPPSGSSPAMLTSAGRSMLTDSFGDQLRAVDRGTFEGSLGSGTLIALSGPYVLWEYPQLGAGATQVSTVKNVDVPSPSSARLLFGSQVLGSVKDAVATGVMRIVVTDLTGASPPKTYALPAGTAGCNLDKTWGDTVSIVCDSTLKIYNYRTGALLATRTGAGASILLGDGYAVVGLGGGVYGVWALGSGTVSALPCIDKPADDGIGHIACWDSKDLIWDDYSSLSTSPARLLGALAPAQVDYTSAAAWALELDATKPLNAGTVVITKADGTVVRTFSTPTSPDGSIRGISWDGTDAAANPVPHGTYTWQLNAASADGTGNVVAIGGTAAATGTVTVTGSVGETTPTQAFVKAAYQDFLGRQPSATELATQNAALYYGSLSKEAFLSTMANSDAWLNAIVTKMYNDTLGRAPDPPGLAGWVNVIRTKQLSVAEVASKFYVSDEYYLHAGGTPTSWVTSLYTQILGRAPEPAGLQYWVDMTNKPGYGRHFVGFFFYQSTESRRTRVANLYQALLKRAPDPTGWPYWTEQVYTTGDITLAINLAESLEYWIRAGQRY